MTRKKFKDWLSKTEWEIAATASEALYKDWDIDANCIFFILEAIDYLKKARNELDKFEPTAEEVTKSASEIMPEF